MFRIIPQFTTSVLSTDTHRAWLEKHDNRTTLWVTEPRASFAFCVSGVSVNLEHIKQVVDAMVSDRGSYRAMFTTEAGKR